jgi:hypothetical protein
LVAIFHASVNATISKLALDVFPSSNAPTYAILMGVIVVAAMSVTLATRGREETSFRKGR